MQIYLILYVFVSLTLHNSPSKLTEISKSRSLTFLWLGFMVNVPVTSSPFLLVR